MSDATLIAQAATELGAQLEHPSMSDLADACPDDPDGQHFVGCGCDADDEFEHTPPRHPEEPTQP